ncbi:mRNA interferase [Lactobacillus phage LpeD]|uniref:mRNA interferase n=1 Tax=Lactobacillus phage LpeD TaxID=2041210 RepID=A0A291I9M9_9CAUD|nr:MazF-like growth inhibitor [Lactobacillus phage LpeD]ATG86401.1 mRNA interferase [Lactobacillus phage LpeD]
MENDIIRGDIYYVNLPEQPAWSHIQSGCRPCIVIQNDLGNRYSPNTIVIPLTTRHKPKMSTHFLVTETPIKSTGLAESVVTVNKTDLTTYLGHVSDYELNKMNTAIKNSLGL